MNIFGLSLNAGALVLVAAIAVSAQQAPQPEPGSGGLAKLTQYVESGSKGPWAWQDSLDAVTAAPKNHKVLFENDRVRVLQVTTYPHQKENVHTHPWPSAVINPVDCKNDWSYSDGKGNVLFDSQTAVEQGPYELVQWRSGPEPPHAIENLGDSSCISYRVEIKTLTTAGHVGKWLASTDGPVAAPKNHKVIFENEYVRVLELFGAAYEKERPHVHPWPSVNLQVSPWFDFLNHGEGAAILFDSRTANGISCPCAHWDDPAASHWIENLSDKSWHGYRVELKQ